MIENLKRVREPVAWILLSVIVASMALSIVSLVRQMAGAEARDAVFAAFAAIASNSMNLTLVVSLVALVCLCLFIAPATAHAAALARAALVVVALGTLLTIVATALGVAASAGIAGIVFELLGGLLDIALKVVAVAVLWVIHRAVGSGRMVTPAPVQEEALPLPPRAIEPEAPVVWRASEAAGTVWATAAEAAAGGVPAGSPPPVAAPSPGAAVGDAFAADAPAAAPASPAPRSAWSVPFGREGAAEALGWRRADRAAQDPSTDAAPASRDTP
nr:hypothetical protein [Propionibacterium sp.]